MSEPRARIGVWRRTCPHPVAATAEARVVRHELERRLGELTLDLRVEGDRSIGPWAPLAHAAWPTDIDILVDPSELFADDHPPLTVLFARTVDPRAADVRRRMLTHLGLIDGGTFGDDTLRTLAAMTITPTDLWLAVTSAERVAVSDAAVTALATGTDLERTRLDEAFDMIAVRLRTHDPISRSADRALQRTQAELADVRARCDELARLLARERAESAATIDALADRDAARRLEDPDHRA